MLVQLIGSAVFGVDAHLITLEVNIDKGIGYHLVGLPDNAIKESYYRIAAVLKILGTNYPRKRSPSTWPLQICARKALRMISPLPGDIDCIQTNSSP